jgi:hypothetical protein
MPKILSQVSVPNGCGIKILSGNYYVLNNTTKGVDQYNSNFSFIKSTNVMSGNVNNLIAFDVEPNGTIIALDDTVTQNLRTITSSGNTSSPIATITGSQITGVQYDSGNLWFVTKNNTLYQTDMSFNILKSVNLPNISPNNLGYKGMTIANNYLVVSFNSSDITGVYHIDRTTGNIVNAFSLPNYTPIVDIEYDGTNFIFMTQTGSQLIFTNGNTLYADMYTIEQNIKNNGFLYMVDDMGVKRKITVSNYSIDRVAGYLTMYNIQITASKIDRG